jgi:hypothetical protein
MRYSPEQIDAIESFRESPYCSMSGCFETEQVVQAVVRWLISNGNEWNVPLPDLTTIAKSRYLKHTHSYYSDDDAVTMVACDFTQKYTNDGVANERFIELVHRRTDGVRLNDKILKRLRPDIFPE